MFILARTFCAALVAMAALSSMASFAEATTYYVDFGGGSDAAAGTSPSAAFKRCPGDPEAVARAGQTVLQPGDTVIFKGGVHYRGTVKAPSSGRAGSPITLDGNTAGTYGEGRAIVDATDLVTGWRRVESAEEAKDNPNWRRIYWAPAPAGTTPLSWNMSEDDGPLYLAQHPNPDDPFWADDTANFLRVPSEDCTLTSIADARLAELGGEDLVGDFVFLYAQPNWISYCRIIDYDPAAHKITFTKGDHHSGLVRGETPYSLLNNVRFIDRPGEYCFDEEAGRIYFWPRTEGDIREKLIGLSRRKVCIDLAGQSHVTVQGFRVQSACGGMGESGGSGILGSGPAEGAVLRDNEITMCRSNKRQGNLRLARYSNSIVENNYLHHNPFYRVMLLDGIENCVVRGNVLEDNDGTGLICFRAKRTRILGNTFRRHLGVHSQGMAIYAKCSEILVEGNICIGNRALTLSDGQDFTVRNNVFYSGGGAAVGIWGGGVVRNALIVNNVFLGASDDGWDRGIALFSNNDYPDSNYIVKNNILNGWLFEGPEGRHEVASNLFTSLRDGQVFEGGMTETDLRGVFVNPADHDYRLAAGSPAIDAGEDVSGLLPVTVFPDHDFSTDQAGGPRVVGDGIDIGAYEYERD